MSRMPVCDHCNIETNIIYICDRCGGKFCLKHKKHESHSFDGHDYRAIVQESEVKVIPEKQSLEPFSAPQVTDQVLGVSTSKKHKILGPNLVNVKLVLVSLLLVSVVVNSYLYLQYTKYNQLSGNYINLFDTTQKVQGYYDNLTTQYSELRFEYTQLRDLYVDLLESNTELEKEYNDLLNYEKEIVLVKEKTITIPPNQNFSEAYSIPFSGIIDVNYTATDEAYTWIGSSGLESGYYSRNPQFPETASAHSFTVPVLPDFLIYFANPSENEAIQITYWIKFTY